MKKGLILGVSAFFATVSISPDKADAGELFRGQRSVSGGQGQIRIRRVQPSTRASQLINRMPSRNQIISFNQASPYEYRVVAYDNSMRRYQNDYARWEKKVEQLEQRAELKQIRDKKRDSDKAKRDRDRAAKVAQVEKQREVAKRERASRPNSGGGFFSRAFAGLSSNKPVGQQQPVIQDEKSRRAADYFGSKSVVEGAAPAPAKQLSFWQRLKKALFGGA